MLLRFSQLFPVWAILLSIIAFVSRDFFAQLSSIIIPLLTLVMFLMGLTLSLVDFKRIIAEPKAVFIGVGLQFILMPITAVFIANSLQLSSQLTAGMVLVGCCAGGTASNVICFLAKGDLALSISMTLASTLIGVVATPLLCTFYLSQSLSIDTQGMFFSILQMVLLPVIVGSLCNHYFPQKVAVLATVLPSASIVIILLIIAIIVAHNAERLFQIGLITVIAVILHNLAGLCGGFYLSRLLGLSIKQSQTVAIEVGMQNSGLAVALATQFFSATAALPAAIFSIWHNISGSLLATRWAAKHEDSHYLFEENL